MSEGLAQRGPRAHRCGPRAVPRRPPRRTKARAGHLTTEDDDLTTEDDDLEFLGGIVPTAGEQRPEQHTNM